MNGESQEIIKLRESCQNNFFNFCKAIHREDGYKFAKFHNKICDLVQDDLNYASDPRLCFSVPPGYGKSSIISKLLPAFLLGRNPKHKIILITYGSKLSDSLGKECRALMNRNIYKLIFPDTIIQGDGKSGSFETTQGGGLRAVGRGGAIIGFRANFILCDDIIKDTEEAMSDKIINKIHDWFPTVPMTRLLPNAGVIILSTRWTKKDLIGMVTDTSDRWKYYNFECICEDVEKDPIGRKEGENLWDFYNLESRKEIRRTNPKMFETVYQGKPVSDANRCIFLNDIEYTTSNFINEDDYIIASYDTASKTDIQHDYSAITIWNVSRDKKKAILSKLFRKKMEFPKLIEAYKEIDNLYKPNLTIIEDKNSGIQLIQVNKDHNWILPSKAFPRADAKIQMAEIFNYKLNQSVIKFHESIRRQEEALEELSEFPFGKHDDFALSILHFLKWFLDSDVEPIDRELNSKLLARKQLVSRIKQNNRFLSKKPVKGKTKFFR